MLKLQAYTKKTKGSVGSCKSSALDCKRIRGVGAELELAFKRGGIVSHVLVYSPTRASIAS